MGSARRPELSKKSTVPGPGTYTQHSKVGEGPKYGIRPKSALIKQSDTPGPGQYTPKKETVTKRPPSAVSGKELRRSFEGSKEVPGPGTYMYQSTLNSYPAFSFGTGKPPVYDSGIPGPGAYKIPSTIPDLPNYAMPEKSKQYHWV